MYRHLAARQRDSALAKLNKNLVYYEQHTNVKSAIHRKKRLKEWKRQWKLNLIEKFNPNSDDLYKSII